MKRTILSLLLTLGCAAQGPNISGILSDSNGPIANNPVFICNKDSGQAIEREIEGQYSKDTLVGSAIAYRRFAVARQIAEAEPGCHTLKTNNNGEFKSPALDPGDHTIFAMNINDDRLIAWIGQIRLGTQNIERNLSDTNGNIFPMSDLGR